MSSLASIQKILSVNPIPNADAIEVVKINGWEVVAKKGEFKEGDLCVYFQIDSFLPVIPQFSFLKDLRKMDDKEGYRLRTVKLRGQVSQGLALPLADFGIDGLEEGTDVSEALGVLKYEKPIAANLRGQAKGYLPSFIRKTDEERIQNISLEEIQAWKDESFVQTLKRDGSSMTVYCVKEINNASTDDEFIQWRFGVCSRNLELLENENNAFWKMAYKLNLVAILPKICCALDRSLALQGELYGEGIQNNPHKIKGTCFEVFNIWDIDNQEYLGPIEVMNLLSYIEVLTGQFINYVPTSIGVLPLAEFGETHEDFLKKADDAYKHHDGGFNEGHVYKSVNKIDGKIVSFKVVSNQYLLKVEE